MKTKAKIGGIIDLEILRANGDVEYVGKIHNVVGAAAETRDRVIYNNTGDAFAGIPTFYARTDVGTTLLDGSFSQSGTTVTRVSGTSSLTDVQIGDLLEFGTGQRGYKTASISASSCTVSKSQTVGATTLKRHKTRTTGWGYIANGVAAANSGSSYNVTSNYTDGVVTTTMALPRLFPAAVSAYTLRCITAGLNMSSQAVVYATYYDLPSEIPINIGDVIIIKSWVYTVTFDTHLPRVFGASPISGLTGSGRYQRLHLPQSNENKTISTPRIFLISDANKITIPNMPSFITSYINPSTLTSIETLIASTVLTDAGYANNNTSTLQIIASPNIGGTVKQIIWGENTQAFGVIEFDTPVVIPPDVALSIVSSLQMVVELP